MRTPMENDARLKRIELTQKALDQENRVRENIMAVSYTHLDVYKRQAAPYVTAMAGRLMMEQSWINNVWQIKKHLYQKFRGKCVQYIPCLLYTSRCV